MPVLTPYMISRASMRSFEEGAAAVDPLAGVGVELDAFAVAGDGDDVFDGEVACR